jgi:nucleotide-binding universal stress UspA family protein
MKNILIPTDFSECSRAAEDIGLEIAKKANSEIHFLHIINTPIDWVNLSLEKESLYPDTKAEIGSAKFELSELEKRAEKMGLKARRYLLFNKGRVEIDQHIKHHKHDFVVMGSRGTEGLREITGSNTQKVVRHSPAPVLVIKKKTNKFEVKNIVFASTFEEDVHLPFHNIIEFADLMDAQIHLLYVNMPSEFKETGEAKANMQAFLEKCPRGNCSINIFNALNEESGIQKFAESIDADMVAITTHGNTGIIKIISPGITESLVNHSDIPILSVNINS